MTYTETESSLRQTLWDVYTILGFDTDGDKTPDAVVDLEGCVRRAAEDFRKDYDEACDEVPLPGYVVVPIDPFFDMLLFFAGPCTLDHDGDCQAHNLGNIPCSVEVLRDAVTP